MYTHRIEEETLDAVDQLKGDLHRKLIERLDLDALEQIKDERVISAEIRRAVLDLLRDEPTPLSQSQRDEIIEQIIY